MENTVVCNACFEMFTIEKEHLEVAKAEDLEVQYFSCPHCGKKYIALVTDSEMRRLIATTKEISMRLKLSHAKRFRSKEIRKYERTLAVTKRRQEQIEPGLKKLGYALLEREVHHEPEQ